MINILHILTRTYDDSDKILMAAWKNKGPNQRFELPPMKPDRMPPDYDLLVNLIFESDRTITW